MIGVNFIFFLKDCHRKTAFVTPHLVPLPASSLNENDWCAIIARPDFFNRPIEERVQIANTFFSEHVEPFATDCLDIEKFRENFIKSAKLSLKEAPIQFGGPDRNIAYRDISSYSWHEGIQIWRIMFHWVVLLISAIESAIVVGILAGCISLFKWVKKGFTGS